MKDKIEIEELHKNHIKVKLKNYLVSSIKSQKTFEKDKKQKSIKYKDIL